MDTISKLFFDNNFSFYKFHNVGKSLLGDSLQHYNDSTVSSEYSLINYPLSKIGNGYSVEVRKEEVILNIEGGVLVFIGDKDECKNSVIIQGNNGIDYWYCNIHNVSKKIYDYVNKSEVIGTTIDDTMQLYFKKNGKFVLYEELYS